MYTGGGSFELMHPGNAACGIPDAGDTIVLIGGLDNNYVTRWVDGKIIINHHNHHLVNNNSDDDCGDYDGCHWPSDKGSQSEVKCKMSLAS